MGFSLVEMTISTNQKPTIYRDLYENTDADIDAFFTNVTNMPNEISPFGYTIFV